MEKASEIMKDVCNKIEENLKKYAHPHKPSGTE